MSSPRTTLTTLLGNSQRLDGGSMFGNAPRALWQRWIAPDDAHRVPLACRVMLMRDGARNVLFEAGIGAFFPPKLRNRFGVQEPEHVLLASLAAEGLGPEDIDVIVLSHLHFDHAGGVLAPYEDGEPLRLVFPHASYVVGAEAFARAEAPHARDRASFIPELQGLLRDTGRLELVSGKTSQTLGEAVRFHYASGHTPGLLMAEVQSEDGPIVYASDLIPGRPWVHLPITMGYDRYPELLIDEKRELLTDLVERGGSLVFTHDPEFAMSRVVLDERGRFGAGESFETVTALPLQG